MDANRRKKWEITEEIQNDMEELGIPVDVAESLSYDVLDLADDIDGGAEIKDAGIAVDEVSHKYKGMAALPPIPTMQDYNEIDDSYGDVGATETDDRDDSDPPFDGPFLYKSAESPPVSNSGILPQDRLAEDLSEMGLDDEDVQTVEDIIEDAIEDKHERDDKAFVVANFHNTKLAAKEGDIIEEHLTLDENGNEVFIPDNEDDPTVKEIEHGKDGEYDEIKKAA